jgi:hypothetical protein
VAKETQGGIKKLRGQIIRSGTHGEYTITREAVEGMLEQMEASPKPVNVEHDPTRPPVGRIVKPRLVELPDGEVALETETELFDEAVPAILKSARALEEEVARLPGFRIGEGPLGLTVDPRSYRQEDIEAIRESATGTGEIEVFDNALRFSVLPDALLVIGLGTPTVAAWWFSKGFFTKLGEMLGEAVGEEMASNYRAFKVKTLEAVERRKPRDRPPITMFTLQIPRLDGGVIEVEGSTRGLKGELEAFLDAGSQLLPIAEVYARAAAEPERLAKMHFAHTEKGWKFVYGLDVESLPVMIIALSEDDYAKALDEAKDASQPPPP